MKGRLPSFIMVLVALALVFSMVATVAPSANVASAQTGGLNSWVRHDLPTTLKYQMMPNSNIWDLTSADDGTLFALVEDTSGLNNDLAGCALSTAADIIDQGNSPCCWNGFRWAVFPAYSDVSLMKSTDGGYTWTIMWHQPASDRGAPIAVVPQPGYVDGDSANSVVFVATGTRYLATSGAYAGGPQEGNIYRSFNGGAAFTRVTPRNPAVTLVGGGTITSMDVAENTDYPGTFMALVGISSLQNGGVPAAGFGEGVYTWNEDDDRDWRDKQVSNALPPAPFPGTMPAGNGLDVIAVKASPTYTEDQILMAVVSDINALGDPAGMDVGVYFCIWDGMDGVWGGDVDSPTNAAIGAIPGPYAWYGVIEVADDFSKGNNVFVGIDGTGQLPGGRDDVWRIAGRPTVTGPSAAMARGLIPALPTIAMNGRISDMQFIGSAGSGALYVSCEAPLGTTAGIVDDGQAQVFRGESMTLWPSWTPAFKPPSGAWPVTMDLMGETLMVAGGGDGWTTGGVHRCAAGCMACAAGQRMAFNGVGLMDDIAVSEDIPGYVNNGVWPTGVPLMLGTTWCLAEAVAEEVSPAYATDNLMYVSTFSEWNHDDGLDQVRPQMANLSLWRWTDGMHWERVLYEFLTMPVDGPGVGVPNPAIDSSLYAQYRGKPMLTLTGQGYFYNDWTWWPRVSDGFSEDTYVFLLGGLGDSSVGGALNWWWREMLWYSPDLGDTWMNVQQMPLGAINRVVVPAYPSGTGLSETGWWVETNQVVLMGDVAGWIYKTTDRGTSWSEGALTALGLEISSIITSPIYSETGASDKVVLVGTFDGTPRDTFGFTPNMGLLPPCDLKSEVWISQDGCEQDLENVGAELDTDPAWRGDEDATPVTSLNGFGGPVVNFDNNWETNNRVYGAAGGYLDRWELVGLGATTLTRIDSTDVGLYRTAVDLTDPSASTWEQIWTADDFMAITKDPQPYPAMVPTENVYRAAFLSDLQVAEDNTIYVPFAIWDNSYNCFRRPPEPPSPMPWDGLLGGNWHVIDGDFGVVGVVNSGYGRFTNGGVIRTLDGTQKAVEICAVMDGLGEWDGLYLNRAPAGGSNILVSLAWDWQEWRFKLALLDDTLSTTASSSEPSSGDTGVGTLADNKVSVTLKWGQLDADVYEWQVDDDCGFVEPMVASGVTSEELVTVTNLEPGVSYCWRVRATEPYWSRWSTAQSFTTVIGAKLLAPELLAPAPGATIGETEPTFQWTSIGWADKYQIQVATSSAFGSSDMVVNENLGDVQAYQASKELAEGTYYWHVKASSDTSSTQWSSTGTFTISEGAGEGGGTSAWVWVLIVVGILLIILILVLIMRTRRPA